MDSIPLPKIIFKDVYSFALSLCTFVFLSSLALLTYFYLIRNYDITLFYFNLLIFFITIGLIIWLTRKWYIDIQKPQNEMLSNRVKQQNDDIEKTKKLNESITNDIEKLKEKNKDMIRKIDDLYSIAEKLGVYASAKYYEDKKILIGENSDE